MQFNIHPSKSLQNLFKEKPYQGQTPEKASIIFLSSDANYSEEISNHSFFKFITEYQQDGVKFWEKYDRHHPFLLDSFPFKRNSGGRPFHNTFSRLGLTKEYARHVSFVELLDIPTIGNKTENKKLFYSLINIQHLKFLDSLILSDSNKLILISSGVLQNMCFIKSKFDIFRWLDCNEIQNSSYSKKIDSNQIQKIHHFSDRRINNQLNQIKFIIDQWLKIDFNNDHEIISSQKVQGKNNITSGKSCAICNMWFQNSEFAYSNREKNSYCRSCNRENQAAYAIGGAEAARTYREAKRASAQNQSTD